MKVPKTITEHPYAFIVLLFLISVLIRVPDLDRPLSKHHEFCTATSLRTMQIWADSGIRTYHFNPIMTYPCNANKFINNQTLSDFDKNGDSYYKSYPPGAYLLPFLIFKTLHIYPDVLPLEIYNMLLQLAECFFLFMVVLLFTNDKNREEIKIIGLLAVIFQLFNASALWFHSNAYMSDMQAVTLFVISVYVFLKIVVKEQFNSAKWLILLGLSNFALNYTEYLGVTFSVIVGIYCLLKALKDRRFLFPFTVLFMSSIGALSLMFYQYSLINGFHQLMDVVRYRYNYRSGYNEGSNFALLLWRLQLNYLSGFLPELIFIVICAIVLFATKSFSPFAGKVKQYSMVAIIFSFPVLLHHFLFLNASQHDFQVLKASPALSLLCAGIIYFLYKRNYLAFLQEYRLPSFFLIVALITGLNILLYYTENLPGRFSYTGDLYERDKVAGLYIKDHSSPGEVIFIKGFEDEPQMIFYARRNIRTIQSDSDAENFLKQYQEKQGAIFVRERSGFVITEKHIAQ